MWELNVRRFGAHLRDRRYAAEKAREVYRYYYAPRFPSDEGEWGRPLRMSPLIERLWRSVPCSGSAAAGSGPLFRSRSPAAGRRGRATWDRPGYWEHVAREHRAVRERVGVLDMTSFGKLDVTGPGALAFLQRLCANDVDRPSGASSTRSA